MYPTNISNLSVGQGMREKKGGQAAMPSINYIVCKPCSMITYAISGTILLVNDHSHVQKLRGLKKTIVS